MNSRRFTAIIRSPHPTSFTKRDVMECQPGSLRLDAGELDHVGPLLGFVGDQLGEVGSGAGKWFTTEIGHPRLHRGLGERRVDLAVQSLHDFGWSAPGRADA